MFDSIIGNENIKNMFNSDDYQLRNTYIFLGNQGIGKFTMAKELATNKSQYNQNILIIDSDKDIIVDDIRQIEDFIYRPAFGNGNRRTVIINNSDTMSVICQNMLLKLLENPPEYALFILIVSDASSLLDTIISRANVLRFNNLKDSEIDSLLNDVIKDVGLMSFVKACVDGSVSEVLKIKSDKNTLLEYQNLYKISIQLEKLNNTKDIYKTFLLFDSNRKNDLMCLYRWFCVCARTCASKGIDYDKYYQYSVIISKTLDYIKNTNDFSLSMDIMLLKICKYNGR